MLFVLPSSTSYEMSDFGFGAGGGMGDSSNYTVTGILGETSGDKNIGNNYNLGPGLILSQQSNVPAAPTFTNPANYYNKLKFILDTGGNPSDTLFAIAITSDNFMTTNYVQGDNTIGATAVYQTYAAWGGITGANVVGLTSGTMYQMKVKAVQTKYTETELSAAATATTLTQSLTYDIDVSATDTDTAPPYVVAFGLLNIGSVTTAANKVWIDIDTNAESGAQIYAFDSNSGLSSASTGNTITSATADLAAESSGYGLQISSVTQSAGGPLAKVSPFDLSGENVGFINTFSQTIFSTSGAPIIGGRGSIYLKAKASTTTPAANDFADTITMIASGSF